MAYRRYASAIAVLLLGCIGVLAAQAGFRRISERSRVYESEDGFPRNSPEVVRDLHDNRIQCAAIKSIHLLAMAAPKTDRVSFQIQRQKNPEIRLPEYTRLTLNVVNLDPHAPHSLSITDQPPPYPHDIKPTPIGTGVMAPYHGRFHGAVLILKATRPGTFYYVSTVPGDAQAGMWGKIVVTF